MSNFPARRKTPDVRQDDKLESRFINQSLIVMDTIINNATSSFATTTGFTMAQVLAWVKTNLIDLFLGSGLGLLYTLRGWIVALVVIGAIVYFAYRAFRFFRH